MTTTLDKIPSLTILFKNPISVSEIPSFRGAIISKVPPTLVLFHNHEGDNFRYHYPLIQYKRIKGNAAIVCLGPGTESIGAFFASADFNLVLGQREDTFEIESLTANQWILQTWGGTFRYIIKRWIPFNSTNYAKYNQLNGIVERTQMLERILIGNILSMCTGLGVHLDKQIVCKVTNISKTYVCNFKNVGMQCMDVEFECNVYMQNYIGLGKGASHGFGMVIRTCQEN